MLEKFVLTKSLEENARHTKPLSLQENLLFILFILQSFVNLNSYRSHNNFPLFIFALVWVLPGANIACFVVNAGNRKICIWYLRSIQNHIDLVIIVQNLLKSN